MANLTKKKKCPKCGYKMQYKYPPIPHVAFFCPKCNHMIKEMDAVFSQDIEHIKKHMIHANYDTAVGCPKCGRIQYLYFKYGLKNGWSRCCDGKTMPIIMTIADVAKEADQLFSGIDVTILQFTPELRKKQLDITKKILTKLMAKKALKECLPSMEDETK